MRNSLRIRILVVAIVGIACGSVAAPDARAGIGCAYGSGALQVYEVEEWDRLNLRAGPGARHRRVGSIPPFGKGVSCLGPCRGNWCRVRWRGVTGWANMYYLGE